MAFAHREGARLLLVRASTDRRNDAAGFTSCCGLVSCSAPLRTRPLDHARGLCYRGPWRLPGPDSHRLAALSLSIGYVTTTSTSLLSWRPISWTHPPSAGSAGAQRGDDPETTALERSSVGPQHGAPRRRTASGNIARSMSRPWQRIFGDLDRGASQPRAALDAEPSFARARGLTRL